MAHRDYSDKAKRINEQSSSPENQSPDKMSGNFSNDKGQPLLHELGFSLTSDQLNDLNNELQL